MPSYLPSIAEIAPKIWGKSLYRLPRDSRLLRENTKKRKLLPATLISQLPHDYVITMVVEYGDPLAFPHSLTRESIARFYLRLMLGFPFGLTADKRAHLFEWVRYDLTPELSEAGEENRIALFERLLDQWERSSPPMIE